MYRSKWRTAPGQLCTIITRLVQRVVGPFKIHDVPHPMTSPCTFYNCNSPQQARASTAKEHLSWSPTSVKS